MWPLFPLDSLLDCLNFLAEPVMDGAVVVLEERLEPEETDVVSACVRVVAVVAEKVRMLLQQCLQLRAAFDAGELADHQGVEHLQAGSAELVARLARSNVIRLHHLGKEHALSTTLQSRLSVLLQIVRSRFDPVVVGLRARRFHDNEVQHHEPFSRLWLLVARLEDRLEKPDQLGSLGGADRLLTRFSFEISIESLDASRQDMRHLGPLLNQEAIHERLASHRLTDSSPRPLPVSGRRDLVRRKATMPPAIAPNK